MAEQTATATNPTDANASTEASATTLLATAGTATTDTTQQTQTTETPAATTAATTDKAAPTTETAAAATVPEKYEFKAPEGTEYDPEILESFSGAAKEAGLTQDAAQKVIEKMAPALLARQVDQVQAIQAGWADATRADKEFGGDKLQENLAIAKKALNAFDPLPAGTKDPKTATPLRTLLEETGLGSHPEVIRLLYRAGKAISEDTVVTGSARGAVNPASVLYDKTPQKA